MPAEPKKLRVINVDRLVVLLVVGEDYAAGDRAVDALEACGAPYRNVWCQGGWQIEVSGAVPRVRAALADALGDDGDD